LVIRLKASTLTENGAKNLVAFLLDCPVENLYAFLLPLREIAQFSTDVNMKAHVLENKQLVDKTKEARLAKEAYKAAKEERERKSKTKESDIPF
jgi:hypothetical protein